MFSGEKKEIELEEEESSRKFRVSPVKGMLEEKEDYDSERKNDMEDSSMFGLSPTPKIDSKGKSITTKRDEPTEENTLSIEERGVEIDEETLEHQDEIERSLDHISKKSSILIKENEDDESFNSQKK